MCFEGCFFFFFFFLLGGVKVGWLGGIGETGFFFEGCFFFFFFV